MDSNIMTSLALSHSDATESRNFELFVTNLHIKLNICPLPSAA